MPTYTKIENELAQSIGITLLSARDLQGRLINLSLDTDALAKHARQIILDAHPKSEPYIGADYYDEDGDVAAFKPFVQYVGRTMAYYEGPEASDGKRSRYVYQTFAWQSADPAKIIKRIGDLAEQIAEKGADTIVWRCKPEFVREKTRENAAGIWRFSCRLHVLPYVELGGAKEEGAPTPEA